MRVIRNDQAQVIIFSATNLVEQEDLDFIVANTQVGEKLEYSGRKTRGDDRYAISFLAGPNQRKILINGTSEEDVSETSRIRDMCFFASGGLIYIGSTELIRGIPSVIFTGCYCSLCWSTMISLIACEWNVCDACSKKCEHIWYRGAGHGGPRGSLWMGEFCKTCGRAKPEEGSVSTKTYLDHCADVANELGVAVVSGNALIAFGSMIVSGDTEAVC